MWKDVADFLYGDMRTDEGFWYSHPKWEIDGLTEELFWWVPDPGSLCILWHLGYTAHRDRTHVGIFLQGLQGEDIPPQYEVGPDWHSPEEVRESIDSVEDVLAWVTDVQAKSREYIVSLAGEDFYRIPPTSDYGMSVAHLLFITVAHTALHVGVIKHLSALVEGKRERAC
jgi:hypothetical protein